MTDTITVDLKIVNRYELYDTVTTEAADVVVPTPPADRGSEDFGEWAYEYIYPFTGTGRYKGDSFYDVTITACSDPTLVGHEFEWGY